MLRPVAPVPVGALPLQTAVLTMVIAPTAGALLGIALTIDALVTLALTLVVAQFDPAVAQLIPTVAVVPLITVAWLAGKAPLLLLVYSFTAPKSDATSFLIDVLCELRCKAGTAKKTINIISPAMANTIITSMMVNPSLLRCLSLFSIASAPLLLNIMVLV